MFGPSSFKDVQLWMWGAYYMEVLAFNICGINSTVYLASEWPKFYNAYYTDSKYYTSENNFHLSVAFG